MSSGKGLVIIHGGDIKHTLDEYFGFLKDKEREKLDLDAGSPGNQLRWRVQDLEGLGPELTRKLLWITEIYDSAFGSGLFRLDNPEEFVRTCEEVKALLEAKTFRVKLHMLTRNGEAEYKRLCNSNTWLYRSQRKAPENVYIFSRIKARSYPKQRITEPFWHRFFSELFRLKTIVIWIAIIYAFYHFPFLTHGTWSGLISFGTIILGLITTIPSLAHFIIEQSVKVIVFIVLISIALYGLATQLYSHTTQPSPASKIHSNNQHQK